MCNDAMNAIAAIIESRSIPEPNSGCWLWTGTLFSSGYGRVKRGGKHYRAHRDSFAVYKGPIPSGMLVCHTCDTRSCVNPEHLFLGTPRDNMLDMARKGRGRFPESVGEANGRAKLTAADVSAIRADSRSHRVIAAEFGVCKTQITTIKAGKGWRNASAAPPPPDQEPTP
jgi:hypothetical protein